MSVVHEAGRGRSTELTRREFLRQAGLGGLSLVGGGALLAACTTETQGPTTTPTPSTTTTRAVTTTATPPPPDLAPLVDPPWVPPQLQPVRPVAIEGAMVFDGEQLLESTTVLLAGGLVEGVGDVDAPDEAILIDGDGKTLLPGLIDAHTHSFAATASQQALTFGITTELDMFARGIDSSRKLDQEQTGRVSRADVFGAGYAATAPGGHGTQFGFSVPTLEQPGQAADWVDRRQADGSDFIKIMVESCCDLPALSPQTIEAVVEEAHQQGLRAVAHSVGPEDTVRALAVGVDGLAHTMAGGVISEEIIDQLRASGGFVVSTMGIRVPAGREAFIQDKAISRYLSDAVIDNMLAREFDADPVYAAHVENLAILAEAAIPLLAGTDAGNPGTAHGAGLLREIEIMVEAGIAPSQALVSATSAPADAFGLPDRGRLRPGLRADAFLVDGDPTEDITALRNISTVWKLGVQVNRRSA